MKLPWVALEADDDPEEEEEDEDEDWELEIKEPQDDIDPAWAPGDAWPAVDPRARSPDEGSF